MTVMKMNFKFDKEKLKTILVNLYELTSVRFALYDDDFTKILAYPEESCEFCSIIKSNPVSRAKCRENDVSACKICRQTGMLYMYKCHCGLAEVVAPIKMNDVIIGYIMFGQICENNEGKAEILKYALGYGENKAKLKAAADKLVCKTENQIKAAAGILEICACYLWLYDIIKVDNGNLIIHLTNYINTNLKSDLSVEHLCSAMGISRSRLYEISHKYYSMSIGDYIRKKRIEKAKQCLSSDDMSVAEAAKESGITDANYFSKVFKSEMGMSPLEFKRQQQSNSAGVI